MKNNGGVGGEIFVKVAVLQLEYFGKPKLVKNEHIYVRLTASAVICGLCSLVGKDKAEF